MNTDKAEAAIREEISGYRLEELERQLADIDAQIGRRAEPEKATMLWCVRADLLGRIDALKE